MRSSSLAARMARRTSRSRTVFGCADGGKAKGLKITGRSRSVPSGAITSAASFGTEGVGRLSAPPASAANSANRMMNRASVLKALMADQT